MARKIISTFIKSKRKKDLEDILKIYLCHKEKRNT